jgi:hypothetical protein
MMINIVCVIVSVELTSYGWNKIIYEGYMYLFLTDLNWICVKMTLVPSQIFLLTCRDTSWKNVYFKGNLKASIFALYVQIQQSKM